MSRSPASTPSWLRYSGNNERSGLRLGVGALVLAFSVMSVSPLGAAIGSAGQLDTTFGQAGRVTTDFSGGPDQARAVALQPDGKIVAAGITEDGKTLRAQFAACRYDTDGSLDSTFGAGGRATATVLGIEAGDMAEALAIQPDGKIDVAGFAKASVTTSYSDFAVVRFNNDGTLDSAFGQDGKVVTDLGIPSYAWGMALQPDGKLVVAGVAQSYSVLVRYNADGSLDSSFGAGGVVKTKIGILSQFLSVALQPDGKLLAAGEAFTESAQAFALARYNPDGTLDTGFGDSGTVITIIFGLRDIANAVFVQQDGLIVVGGESEMAGGDDGRSHFAMARYKKNGALDQSFGQSGKVFTGSVAGPISGFAQQHDARLVAVGDGGLARYNVDGSLDTSFSNGGVITNLNGRGRAIAVQPDDLIVMAGETEPNTFDVDFMLARFDSGIPIPTIQSAVVQNKRLLVSGVNFDPGAAVLVDGQDQQTANDTQNPTTSLIAKRAGKRIAPGQTVRLTVRNRLGTLSHPFQFTRP